MNRFFTSESVTKGHPDKVCDQISDGILDALLRQDPMSRCACETIAEPGAVHIMGEITTKADIDYIQIARDVIKSIGYTKDEYGFTDRSSITCSLHSQSPDIAMGVDSSAEEKDELGAGDQGMMFGYASDETEELMPLAIALARNLTNALTYARENHILNYLRPDGKSQVTIEYEGRKAKRIDAVVVSTQHDPDVDMELLRKDVKEKIILPNLPSRLIDGNTKFYINPTGRFVLGGPAADTGLTGRKIIVDTYGGYAHHGGGAFSGKDATKVDRSAAYAARNIAKTIVASGAAKECEIQLSYAIGVAKPISMLVDTFGTSALSNDQIIDWINRYFDLRPGKIIARYQLRRPIYQTLAASGHFGRTDADAPWEVVDEEAKKALAALAK
jgi:S-adenosylmethionine synthetase